MTHSNGVEDKDVHKKRGREISVARQTKRFTLHLSELSNRDAFDEFSYIALLNSEMQESVSSVALDSHNGDFYTNTGTLEFPSPKKHSISETSIRKKQKLVTRCLSQDLPKAFLSADNPNLFSRMIWKPETVPVLPREIAGSKRGSGSPCLATPNLAKSTRQSCLNGAKNLFPTSASVYRNEIALVASNCPIENCTTGFRQKSTAPAESTCQPISSPAFPNDLPVQLFDVMNRIKQVVGSSEYLIGPQCGRQRFTKEINELLMQVETLSQSVTSLCRDTVFSHLASLLSCDPEFLSKRAKKLCLAQNGDALKDPISRLKEEVQNIMPELIERHNQELLAAEKLLLLQLETKECSASRVVSDSPADEEVQDVGEEKVKRITFPRKKFRWNQAIRMCLCEVVRLKMQHFRASKIQPQSAEEYLKAFLDAEIKPLWPRGWIQTRMLFKESRASHQQWTTNLPKFKKMSVFANQRLRNPSITMQETVASGPSTPFTAPSSVSVCSQHPKTLMDFNKTSCDVKSHIDEDDMKLGLIMKSKETAVGQKWNTELEKISNTVGSKVPILSPSSILSPAAILSPTSILSPTLAMKYWLLKAALENGTDSRSSELCDALHKRDAVMSVPASSVAVAATSSSTVHPEAAASSVKFETEVLTQKSYFVERSFRFQKRSGGSDADDGSGQSAGCGVTDRIIISDQRNVANGNGSLQHRLEEPSQLLKVINDATLHPTYLHSKPMDSNPGPDKLVETGNSSSGKLFVSSESSGFPSFFVFPPDTPLLGLMFCRAPDVSHHQPSQTACTSNLLKNPSDALMGGVVCGPSALEPAKLQPLLFPPSIQTRRHSVLHLGCPKHEGELNSKQNATPTEAETRKATFAVIPSTSSVFRQFLAPVTTT